MTILLDTNVFLWAISENPRISEGCREHYTNANNTLLLSMASIWEIFIKIGTGKLEFPEKPADFLQHQLKINAINLLPIGFHHTAKLIDLPPIHKDPFDRLIIAQGLTEKIPVLSSDPVFIDYGMENLF